MKYLFVILFISILNSFCFSQTQPFNYHLLDEEPGLIKTISTNPISNTITDIITVSDSIVWLGTSRGVSLSTNNGTSWTNFYGSPEFGTDNISAIGYHNGIFWCATANQVETSSGDFFPAGTGLKFTSDMGETWKTIPQPIDASNDTLETYGSNQIRALPVTVTVQNLTYDMAFTSNTIWIASFAGEFRKSRIDSLIVNQNYKFSRVVLPPDNLNSITPTDSLDFCLTPAGGKFCKDGNLNHRVFSVTTDNNGFIYVGTANGLINQQMVELAGKNLMLKISKYQLAEILLLL
jgi:ligand-binding sensor domain-containing protein